MNIPTKHATRHGLEPASGSWILQWLTRPLSWFRRPGAHSLDNPSGSGPDIKPGIDAAAYRAGYDDLWEEGFVNNPYSRDHDTTLFASYQAGSDEAAHDLRFWYGY
jgi:hypothetical protein